MQLFDEVRSAGFARNPELITDATLSPIRWLANLEYLDLGSTGIGDAGLIHIARMTRLEELNLHKTQITDAGLIHLRQMQRLRTLRLDGTSIRGAGLVHLDSPALKTLLLYGSNVTELPLTGSPNLKELALDRTPIDGSALRSLRGLRTSRG